MSNQNDQIKIGELIKNIRKSKGMTQSEFAKALKTSQSAVARMENGGQNFTTHELAKISEVLNRQIISISDSMDFEINGGKKLSGEIITNTSKNGALGILFASILNEGTTIIRGVPRIEEINRVIEFFEALNISVKWINEHDIEIKIPQKINIKNMLHDSAKRIRSSLWIIGPLLKYEKSFLLPNAGGCKMGSRTISAHQYCLEDFGVKVETKSDHYKISYQNLKSADTVLYEMSDGATITALLTASSIEEESTIRFASANYQVQDVCFFLQNLGIKIEGIGTSTLKIKGLSKINKNVEHFVSEDPTESMFFIASAIVTKSNLKIKRCPIDFLRLELLKLEKMGLKYKKSKVYKSLNGQTNLVDIDIKPSKLFAPHDKIHAQPYPGINTDNLPFFATIAGFAEGTTLIHDWMWENRAIYFTELAKLGFDVNLADPHRIYITGKTNPKPTQIVCPPALRPATIILVAMLATPGKSILRNVYSIRRGYEEIADRLNSLGADIKVIRGI
ncbi:MAG TPA: UDP-N-acetylglucosamine 1-carboxyvinyltransferase [Candidatus Paceibacterota bacterium]|nr:UDP-N-acetylglucosamine 1-carboxyvinyltransferase [Candidatus Paceibacterota bacterium]HMP19265.1 UDP-N-acetylglucosamine 1-carboxyvinyltransferase [Candidatus Paceibacterota bacterium]